MLNAVKKTIGKIGIFLGLLILLGIIHEFLVYFSGTIVQNIGISFGGQFPFLIIIESLFCLGCLVLYIKQGSWNWVLMTVGGLINLVDRLRFGFVRDYWELWGSGVYNNINDWIIAFGVILFFIESLWHRSK